jgi:hypothetical protein
MDSKIRQLIDQIPSKPFRSKLQPHLDLIRELRQKRQTYKEISRFLIEHLNLTVAPSTIYAFMHARSRRAHFQTQAAPGTSAQQPHLGRQPLTPNPPSPTPPPASLQPAQASTQTAVGPRKRFHYDPEEGLTLSDEALHLKPRKD